MISTKVKYLRWEFLSTQLGEQLTSVLKTIVYCKTKRVVRVLKNYWHFITSMMKRVFVQHPENTKNVNFLNWKSTGRPLQTPNTGKNRIPVLQNHAFAWGLLILPI